MAFDKDIPTSPLVSLIYRRQNTFLNQKLKNVDLGSGLHALLIKAYKHEGISQEGLAHELHVNESTVTRNLDKLEKKGLVTKTPEKRKKIVRVTEKGAKIAQQIMDYDAQWDDIIKKDLTDEEFENLRKILIKITEGLI